MALKRIEEAPSVPPPLIHLFPETIIIRPLFLSSSFLSRFLQKPVFLSILLRETDRLFGWIGDYGCENDLAWRVFFDCLDGSGDCGYIAGHKNSFVSASFTVPGKEGYIGGLQHLVDHDHCIAASDNFH